MFLVSIGPTILIPVFAANESHALARVAGSLCGVIFIVFFIWGVRKFAEELGRGPEARLYQ